jgi:plasmid maintenance system antidote protein VapI
VALRLARSGGGSVEYWLELPISEMMQWMLELAKQLEEENEQVERARRR